jgi:hypothetical protein
MASPQNQPTRVRPAPPQPAPAPAAGGAHDVRTLITTAAASALAAFICSKVWAPGTLASAAFTPVAVALFREALNKPTAVVTQALPAALPITRRGSGADPSAWDPDHDPTRVHPTGPASDQDPTRVHRAVPPGEQPTRVSPAVGPAGPGPVGVEPVQVHAATTTNRRRRWQIAIVTGLLGFVIAALLITVPEVIAGKDGTTVFQGGRSNTPAKKDTPPAATTTVVQQVTTAPQETVTQEAPRTVTQTVETTTVTQEAPATTTATTPTTTTAPADPTGGADQGVDGP